MLRIIQAVLLLVLLFHLPAFGQDVSSTNSVTSDPNLLDNYSPVSGVVHAWDLSIDKSWDSDAFSVDAAFNSSLQLYPSFSGRNYGIFRLELSPALFLTEADDESLPEPDDSTEVSDSTDSGDSTETVVPRIKPVAPIDAPDTTLTDSLRHRLLGNIFYTRQINQEEFSSFSNSKIGAWIGYRVPIHQSLFLMPVVLVAYHHYPNFDGISSVETQYTLVTGASRWGLQWLELGGSVGIKHYPTATTFYDTVRKGTPGKGKGGGIPPKVVTYDLSTPLVQQFSVSVAAHKSFPNGPAIKMRLTHYDAPSQEARAIPQRLSQALDNGSTIGSGISENELYDDHYSYRGDAFHLDFEQTLGMGFVLTSTSEAQYKNYTIPATDLEDSAIAANRIDHRWISALTLSRTFSLGTLTKLVPHLSTQYLNNLSNSEYNEFEKWTFTLSVDLNF